LLEDEVLVRLVGVEDDIAVVFGRKMKNDKKMYGNAESKCYVMSHDFGSGLKTNCSSKNIVLCGM